MTKHHLIALAAGVLVGYFMANTLSTYQPWTAAVNWAGALP